MNIYALIPFIWLAVVLAFGLAMAVNDLIVENYRAGFRMGCSVPIQAMDRLRARETSSMLDVNISGTFKHKSMMNSVFHNIIGQVQKYITITEGQSKKDPGVYAIEANAFMIHPDYFIELSEESTIIT